MCPRAVAAAASLGETKTPLHGDNSVCAQCIAANPRWSEQEQHWKHSSVGTLGPELQAQLAAPSSCSIIADVALKDRNMDGQTCGWPAIFSGEH